VTSPYNAESRENNYNGGITIMSQPKAYAPEYGYKYQILCRNQQYDRAFEHCDYAKDSAEKKYLVNEYRTAYGAGWEFKSILLPVKYWKEQPTI
jgi:hypothetical protein